MPACYKSIAEIKSTNQVCNNIPVHNQQLIADMWHAAPLVRLADLQ
jgi:hypothetical protein